MPNSKIEPKIKSFNEIYIQEIDSRECENKFN